MVDIICALCKEMQQIEVVFPATFHEKDISPQTFSARRKPDRVHYQILRCSRCGLVFSSPILSETQIRGLYKESSCTYLDQIPYLAKTYLSLFDKASESAKRKAQSAKLRVLEVGCGNGFFLKALIQHGYKEVYGVEPSHKMGKDSPKFLQKRIVVDVLKKGQFPKASFDVVCTFHTLDHVVDVASFMREVVRLLRKGGVFLAVVHDVEGLSVKLFGEKSPIFDIEHVYLFSKRTLTRLCERFGLRVEKSLDVANTYPLSYWWRVTGLPNLFGPLGRIPVTLKAGNIAVVAKKP